MLPIPKWFGLFALAYGITALMAARKLWRMEKTGVLWTRGWAAVVAMMLIVMIPLFSKQRLGRHWRNAWLHHHDGGVALAFGPVRIEQAGESRLTCHVGSEAGIGGTETRGSTICEVCFAPGRRRSCESGYNRRG